MPRFLTAFLLLAAFPAAAQTQVDPEPATGIEAKPLVTAEEFMVAAAHPLAVEAGVEMLEAGGTA
ncbi:MAG TPA: gamma-glutamyltransferase, partial [Paracoccaceae bacterium]|nr:gamma-glutamyltransferase [Paracoccaceae bacterium]